MRERTTWNRDQVTAATNRTADPYAMNQDHLQQQPKADKYLTGDPSTFAEDITEPNTWDREYAGGTTKRDEIGLPAFREETFNHAEKSASMDEKTLVKKADLCTTVARMILRGRKFASPEAATEAVESQAVALMYMPSADLINTASRLASQEDFPGGQTWPSNFAAQEEGQQPQGGQQQQQAQQEGQQQGQGQQEQQGGQQQQGAMQQQAIQKCMEALQKGDQQGAMAALQQVQQQHQAADYDAKKGPAINPPGYGPENGPQAGGVKSVPGTKGARSAAEEGQQQGQGQQQQQQGGQQQQQQQGGQQQQSAEDKALDQMLQQQQQQQGQQQGQPQGQGQGQGGQQAAGYQTADDQLLDDMLMGPQGGGMSEVDIEMEPSTMDMGEVVLSSTDDEVLKTLFANEETQDAEQAQQAQQQKQGGMSRTASTNASTRTLGTRPTGGVSRVGGAPSGGTRNDIDTLSNFWASAPDVREAFNIR
jgi:hypothetical protein